MAQGGLCFHARAALGLGLVGWACAAQAQPRGPEPAEELGIRSPSTPEPTGPADASDPFSTADAWSACAGRQARRETKLTTPAGPVWVQWVPAAGPPRGAVVFTHGAGSPGSATWDLTPDSHSALRTLSCAGFDAYAFDARGFGGSFRPPGLDGPMEGKPAVRAEEAVEDLGAVIGFARAQSRVQRVDLVGWSWGCVVAALQATTAPASVRRLVLFAPVFDRKNEARHITDRRYRLESKELHRSLFRPQLEDKAVHDAFVQALFRFGEDDVLRLPNGPYRDLYGPDAPIWTPEQVHAPTLVIRGSRDRASQREAAFRLLERLTKAPWRRYVELPDAGHFAFRRHTHRRLYGEIMHFLREVP